MQGGDFEEATGVLGSWACNLSLLSLSLSHTHTMRIPGTRDRAIGHLPTILPAIVPHNRLLFRTRNSTEPGLSLSLSHVEDSGHEGLRDEAPTGEVDDCGGQRLDAQLGVEGLAEEVESDHAGQILEKVQCRRKKVHTGQKKVQCRRGTHGSEKVHTGQKKEQYDGRI